MGINTRSPYYKNTATANASYSTLEIFVWNGSVTSPPATPVYNLRKYALTGSTFIGYEISELIRDYIDVKFTNGDYVTDPPWVKTIIKVYSSSNQLLNTITSSATSAFDSYSYFEEEDSFQIDNLSLMMSNREMYVLADNIFRIPISTGRNPSISFFKDNVLISTQSFNGGSDSNNLIKYISINGTTEDYDSFKSRVLADGGTIEDSKCLQDFLEEFEIGEVDEIRITNNTGNIPAIIKVITLDECKYEPKKVTFINKFGVLQDMWFFKKSVETMVVKKESYKANIINQFQTYSAQDHVNRDFNVMGKESVTLSSGYLSEDYNEVFKQLMLSEKVWMTNVTDTKVQVLPINVKTSDITYKTSLNDKLVEYTIEFDNSYDTIQNIR